VAYDFTEYLDEPETQPAPSRGIRPPNKRIGIGLLDRPDRPEPSPDVVRRPWSISFGAGILLILGVILLLLLASLASR
jgi:hypothetical protein